MINIAHNPLQIDDIRGHLTVIGPEFRFPNAPTAHLRERRVLCQCVCGRNIAVLARKVATGHIIQCGCLKRNAKRPRKSLRFESNIYRVWWQTWNCCRNKNHKSYKHYGGMGVTMSSEWTNFPTFERWAYLNGYQENARVFLHRRDAALPYGPNNCFFSMLSMNKVSRPDDQKFVLRPIIANMQSQEAVSS